MTIEEAEKIIKTTKSQYLKRDIEKFIKRQKKNVHQKNKRPERRYSNNSKVFLLKNDKWRCTGGTDRKAKDRNKSKNV